MSGGILQRVFGTGRWMRDQKGQMAIFVALIFQVLFVLFAMAINVALIVHDKINLQNAVDLAAYYAAQRQGEILNVIAHENYQIRQSWKLLAWRYRVLGTMGLDQGEYLHPARPRGNMGYDRGEVPYAAAQDNPGICVGYQPIWLDAPSKENLCNTPEKTIPPFPVPPVIAGFIGINYAIRNMAVSLRERYQNRCSEIGAYNWWFANAILHAFREDQKNRKELIYALADNLSRKNPNGDFVDIRGQSVLAGVSQVLQKNLTYTNGESLVDLQMLNGLALAPTRQDWLAEINVNPVLIYLDSLEGSADSSCRLRKFFHTQIPQRPEAKNVVTTRLDPDGILQMWANNAIFGPTDTYNLAVGIEKNPWVQAYVGVKATTAPRQLFMPFGGTITLTARAYAKPFGARIGPWYADRWPRASKQSIGKPVDSLLPPRVNPANFQKGEGGDPKRLPNYSRFPGDTLGLTSRLAQAALNGQINMRLSLDYFRHISMFMEENAPNDVLAWDHNNPTPEPPHYRKMEIAAVAPDLFDVSYYSIEPNFEVNYRAPLRAARHVIGIPPTVPIRPDLGGRHPQFPAFSVQDQLMVARTGGGSLQGQEAFYFVKNKTHLLTSWVPGLSYGDYITFPIDRFGKCLVNDDEKEVKNPGSCISGGRTGYSVKLVSRDLLLHGPTEIGGTGEPGGTILNPPPVNEGW